MYLYPQSKYVSLQFTDLRTEKNDVFDYLKILFYKNVLFPLQYTVVIRLIKIFQKAPSVKEKCNLVF